MEKGFLLIPDLHTPPAAGTPPGKGKRPGFCRQRLPLGFSCRPEPERLGFLFVFVVSWLLESQGWGVLLGGSRFLAAAALSAVRDHCHCLHEAQM